MKCILILFITLSLSTSLFAQQKKEKKDIAKKVTTEMTQVLGLDESTSTKVLALQTEKFTQLKAANKEHKKDKAALKIKKKEINNDFKAKLNPLLGKDKVKKWTEHLKAKKEKKNKN